MIKSMLTMAAIIAACGMTACAPTRSQPETMSDFALMQSRLAASEAKVEQLSQQVALLQMMVDSHQKTLRNLDKDTGDAAAGLANTPPLPDVPDTQTAPAAPQTKSASPPETEEIPVDEPSRDLQREPAARALTADAAPAADATHPQYQQAMEIFRRGDYESAAPLFEAFAAEFPDDDLADNALYWAGECQYTQKKFTEAIERFKRVVEEYPSGSKVPDALLKIGFAHISLGESELATPYLKQVVAQYPFSSAGIKAEERLKVLQGQ